MRPGPRGTSLAVETSPDIPLVWFRIAALGGAAADPIGREGLVRHAATLARRGSGSRERAAYDQALDLLGASVEASTGRDAITVSGVCLSRNLDATLALVADLLARPHFAPGEHAKLIRESLAGLDEIRDDDGELAERFVARYVAPGHPYARTGIGTEASLAALGLDEARDTFRLRFVPRNLIVGFAGDITRDEAELATAHLVEALPDGDPPPLPTLPRAPLRPRQAYVIDKPDRQQAQIRLAHPVPAYGDDEFRALTIAETVFGGTFSSRLMQEIRVKRGWSYGAGCSLGRSRGPNWLRLSLAPPADIAAEATATVMNLFEHLCAEGVSAEELDFAQSHLIGALPLSSATPAQRMRLSVRNRVFGLPDDFHARLAERLAAVTLEQVNDGIRRWFHPDRATTVIVATAADVVDALGETGVGPIEIVPFDAY